MHQPRGQTLLELPSRTEPHGENEQEVLRTSVRRHASRRGQLTDLGVKTLVLLCFLGALLLDLEEL